MIDINLLNNKKLNDSQSDFFDIDQSLVEKSDQFETKSNKINIKKEKKSKTTNNKSKNSLLILFAVCVLLIVGGCFYYQFSLFFKCFCYLKTMPGSPKFCSSMYQNNFSNF